MRLNKILNALLNWRYYVLFAIFAAGFLSVTIAFGEPVRPMSGFGALIHTAITLAVGIACFHILSRVTEAWKRTGKIHEI